MEKEPERWARCKENGGMLGIGRDVYQLTWHASRLGLQSHISIYTLGCASHIT